MFVPFVAVDGAKRGKESVRTRERMHIASQFYALLACCDILEDLRIVVAAKSTTFSFRTAETCVLSYVPICANEAVDKRTLLPPPTQRTVYSFSPLISILTTWR